MRERCSGVLRASFVLAPSNPGFDRVRGELFLLCKNESRADDQNRQNSAAQQSTKAEGRDLCDSCGGQGRFLFFCFFFFHECSRKWLQISCVKCVLFSGSTHGAPVHPFFFFFFCTSSRPGRTSAVFRRPFDGRWASAVLASAQPEVSRARHQRAASPSDVATLHAGTPARPTGARCKELDRKRRYHSQIALHLLLPLWPKTCRQRCTQVSTCGLCQS